MGNGELIAPSTEPQNQKPQGSEIQALAGFSAAPAETGVKGTVQSPGDHVRARAEMRLYKRAVNGFNLTPQDRKNIREQALEIATTAQKDRTRLAALEVLARLDATDLRAVESAVSTSLKQASIDKPAPANLTVHIHGHGQVNLSDPAALAQLTLEQLAELSQQQRQEPAK